MIPPQGDETSVKYFKLVWQFVWQIIGFLKYLFLFFKLEKGSADEKNFSPLII
ncbi:hypothetical protein [Calothrix rhizosoleniae]|uniref:hypothetical protein n=1 Tax=Calothrix rhizosoleniae TaxID=888997 RepID=UPI0013563EB0|nr:hypothetical protein [Calothrix rhizosoleniae]